MEDIFEQPEAQEVPIPNEWLDKVKTITQTQRPSGGKRTSYPGSRYYQGWQNNFDNASGNRLGPQLLDTDRKRGHVSSKGMPDASSGAEFQGTFWNMTEPYYDDLYGFMMPDAADRMLSNAERRAVGSGLLTDEEYADSLDAPTMISKVQYISEDGEILTEAGADVDDLYQQVNAEHGADVADAYWDISTAMVSLEGKDDLLKELVGEMAGMIKDDALKLQTLRCIYDSLDHRSKESLAQNGI